MKEMVQMGTGQWIEVDRKVKKAAGVRLSSVIGKYIFGSEMDKYRSVRRKNRIRPKKYEDTYLDQADDLAYLVGLRDAAKAMGISYGSLQQWRYFKQIRKRNGMPSQRKNNRRYTLKQKQDCVALAKKLAASNETVSRPAPPRWKGDNQPSVHRFKKWTIGSAFREAGKRLGMNWKSIQFQYDNGLIPEPSTPPPESSPPAR